MKLTFCGAAGGVTGSCYLLESGEHRILIDCGLFQGNRFADAENYEPFSFDPAHVQAVLVTHAHLDHVGRLPKLYREGFRGTIYSTPPTKDCAELILLDSEKLMCREAERDNRAPLCTTSTVEPVMRLWRKIEYHTPVTIGPFTATFFNAGHILGSASIRIEAEGKSITFSGDLGNTPAPIIQPTEPPAPSDYVVVESTYANRTHDPESTRREILQDVIQETVARGGVLMIPSFALERTQDIVYFMNELFTDGRIARVPVFIDSPLAIKLTAIYHKYRRFFNAEADQRIASGDDIFNFPDLHLTLTSEQSKAINSVPPPKIVLAGSGMSHGGRILHHEVRYLPDPNNTILFIGYQAEGSLGRRIMEGANEVTIFGETIPVRCRVRAVSSYSAHADQPKLMHWLWPMRQHLKRVFISHGEDEGRAVFAQAIRDTYAVTATLPQRGESFTL